MRWEWRKYLFVGLRFGGHGRRVMSGDFLAVVRSALRQDVWWTKDSGSSQVVSTLLTRCIYVYRKGNGSCRTILGCTWVGIKKPQKRLKSQVPRNSINSFTSTVGETPLPLI